jgi:hypothetical protein
LASLKNLLMATAASAASAQLNPAARIRPLALGGALDEAVLVIRGHFVPLFKTSLLVTFVPMAIAVYLGYGRLERHAQRFSIPGQAGPDDLLALLREFGTVTMPLLFLAYRVAEPIALGALVLHCAAALHGRPLSLRHAVRASLIRSAPLVALWLVRWITIKISLIFCYFPGILVAGLFLSALPALMLEDRGPLGALGRSVELNRKRMLPAAGLAIVLFLIESYQMFLPEIVPILSVRSLLHAGCYAALLPMYAAACTTFYYSGRCELEHYDVQLLAAEMARGLAKTPATDEPAGAASSEDPL